MGIIIGSRSTGLPAATKYGEAMSFWSLLGRAKADASRSNHERREIKRVFDGVKRLLRPVEVRRKYRVRILLAGAVIGVLGLFFPWYLLQLNPPLFAEGHEFVNAFQLEHNAAVAHDTLTQRGVIVCGVVLSYSLVVAVTEWLGGKSWMVERKVVQYFVGLVRKTKWLALAVRGLSVGLLVLFVKNEWWANVDGGYQESIRYKSSTAMVVIVTHFMLRLPSKRCPWVDSSSYAQGSCWRLPACMFGHRRTQKLKSKQKSRNGSGFVRKRRQLVASDGAWPDG
jgi:hypothetical protein